jgi:predicted esterase
MEMVPAEERATNGISAAPKPAILCLHGGGTNSMIFHIQTIRLQRVLNASFEFVFLDGPLLGEPGPGVIPVFEGLEPYRRWHVKGVDVKPEQTVSTLQSAMEKQRRKDGRGFVGALGFSQGAKVVAGLLLEQQVRQRKEDMEGQVEGLAFGVMFNGTTPPLAADLTDSEKVERISVPSLHVIGTDDPWRGEGLELYGKHFDPKTASLMEFKVGHRLPVLVQDTTKVTNEILRMYAESEAGKQTNFAAVVQ